MKTTTILGAATAVALLCFAPAWADDADVAAARAASDADCRIEVIPAHETCVETQVQVPPVRCEQRVPRYETVRVPVYETRRVPVYETVERPVYEERQVPVYRTERTPVWGEKQVTVYREVRKPVTLEVWNPFACEDACIELWDTCDRVPCGTKTVRAIVGHEERQVECGTRTERVQVGTESERVLTCYRTVREQTGEREERRFAGYERREVVVQAASTRTVVERAQVPCERVTVVPDGTTLETPMRGTSRVLTESEYREELSELAR